MLQQPNFPGTKVRYQLLEHVPATRHPQQVFLYCLYPVLLLGAVFSFFYFDTNTSGASDHDPQDLDMGFGGEAPDEMEGGRVEELQREPHVRYSGLLMSRFSHVAPRLVHAQGSPLRGATFALPEYDLLTQELDFSIFHQTGFGIVPGRHPRYSMSTVYLQTSWCGMTCFLIHLSTQGQVTMMMSCCWLHAYYSGQTTWTYITFCMARQSTYTHNTSTHAWILTHIHTHQRTY